MKQPERLPRGIIRLGIIVAMLVAALGWLATPRQALACPSHAGSSYTPACPNYTWPYGHSWYITNPNEMARLAQGDASWSNYVCSNNPSATDYMTVLNFGRPGLVNGNYVILDHGGAWLTYSQVEQYAEQYASTWYADTSSCPHLHLVIGTGNDWECYNGNYVSGCSVYTAGQKWDIVVHDVQNVLNTLGHAWQETAWGGDDLEAEWDRYTCSGCVPRTVDFLNGYTAQESTYSSHAYLVDYGDADYGQPTFQGDPRWTQQNVYDASWGIGWDYAVPETYTNWLTQQWANVYYSSSVNRYAGNIQFTGNMTECSEADTLPTDTCWVARDVQCEWSPEGGYNLLASDVNQTGITYSTNIQWPDDAKSGNNGCP